MMTLSTSKIIDTSIKIVPAFLFFWMVDASVYMLEGLMVLALIYIASFFPLSSIIMGREQVSMAGAERNDEPRLREPRKFQILHLPILGLLIFGLQVYQTPTVIGSIEMKECKSEQFAQVNENNTLPLISSHIDISTCISQGSNECCIKRKASKYF